MSFGMIFGIIIIAAIIAVAFYVIAHFLNLQKCTDTSLLYNDLQNEVDKAWKSTNYQDTFSVKLPSGIDFVCFGFLNQSASNLNDREKQDSLDEEYSSRSKDNLFLYPAKKTCNLDLGANKINHVEINGFFCVEKENGKLDVKLSKSSSEALVKILNDK